VLTFIFIEKIITIVVERLSEGLPSDFY